MQILKNIGIRRRLMFLIKSGMMSMLLNVKLIGQNITNIAE
jgi:hypothetical protein